MSKKFKSQASSARAASAFGSSGFGFGSTASSSLSYITEQPDLSSISDPALVVSLRNLGKKDSTTKAKALEEIQEHVRSTGTALEDAFISAWIELYPRTSIDNSRRVRQLAHTIQGAVTTVAGKRIVPGLPKIIGAWLCGQYDADRSVARAAVQALTDAIPPREKRQALWKLYKDSLLDYAQDAMLVQTAQTLSDERSTSKDDADTKHARASGSAMTMLGHLIEANSGSSDFHEKVVPLLTNKILWDFVTHSDPYLRRSICALAILCSKSFKEELDWQVISSRFLSKGLAVDHLGSSLLYSQALLALTRTEPTIWTTHYAGKTTVHKRLCQYFKKGSFRGTEEVWRNNLATLKSIPLSALGKDGQDLTTTDAGAFLGAIYDGTTNSDEPRFNLTVAWSCYIDTAYWLLTLIPESERGEFFATSVGQLLLNYILRPRASVELPASSAVGLITRSVHGIDSDERQSALASVWTSAVSQLVETMRLSLPESSKEFSTSQDTVAAISQRLFKVKSICQDEVQLKRSKPLQEAFSAGDEGLQTSAISLLRDRNCKPYGCASVLLDLALQAGYDQTRTISFMNQNTDALLASPSAKQFVEIWRACHQSIATILKSLLANTIDERSEKALVSILMVAEPSTVHGCEDELTDLVRTQRRPAIVSVLLKNPALQTTKPVTQYLETFLQESSPDAQLEALSSFSGVESALLASPRAKDIMARLLFLTDSSESDTRVVESASGLLSRLQSQGTVSGDVITDQLAGKQPFISILSLVELAAAAFREGTGDKSQVADSLLPTIDHWSQAIRPHLLSRRPYSLAITCPLQAVVYTLVDGSENTPADQNGDLPSAPALDNAPVPRDADDFSMAFRLALYTVKLLSLPSFIESLATTSAQAFYEWLPIALQLINEKLSLESANEAWSESTPEVLDEAADVLSDGNTIIQQLLGEDSFTSGWLAKFEDLQGSSVEAYIRGLAFADITSRLSQQDGGQTVAARFDSQIKQMHKPRKGSLIQNAAIASSGREYVLSTNVGRKTLNELISDVTQLNVESLDITNMSPLVLLNILLDGDSEALQGISSQRLVFLMQNLVRLLAPTTLDLRIESEIFKLLSAVLPAVQDIYGNHWQEILDSLVSTWTELNDSDEDLPMLHSTLRVYRALRELTKSQDANEDLLEAWEANKDLPSTLQGCLQLFGKTDQGINQPRQICAELLGRLLRGAKVEDVAPIFPLLQSPSNVVLETAFSLIYDAVPAKQEQLSLEIVLEKQTVQLPTELMALVNDVSTEASRYRYFLAWKLIYRHFSSASYRLREMYTASLKGSNSLSHLLDTLCSELRIIDRPIDASKYTFDDSLPSNLNTAWLATDLYHSCLLYTPGLAKSWYIEQKNRIRGPLETWTQKYITPSLITASFAAVAAWAETQDQDDSPLTIKSNPRASELIASMPIDPESPAIAILVSIPTAYPLNSPTVSSKTRVAVSEKNWQSWLRTIQIIIFSTGSIIEGLVAFRRNVQGALKGQGECAICYSIIGTDMQTPNKKCGVCGNAFHGGCLYRWFRSSNSSTCPLCRNAFSYA